MENKETILIDTVGAITSICFSTSNEMAYYIKKDPSLYAYYTTKYNTYFSKLDFSFRLSLCTAI